MAANYCLLCGDELTNGQKVVRVETVVISDEGCTGTTGWSPSRGQLIHLHHLEVLIGKEEY